MRNKQIIIISLLLIFSTVACLEQNNQVCEESILIGTDITTLMLENHQCTLNQQTEQDQVTFKIRSQNELEDWLSCNSSLPDIDFDQEFIVGGRVKSYGCGHLLELVSKKWCDNLKVKVIIRPQDCLAITDVYFFVALPVVFVNSEVEIDVINLES
jgi:hypothetical protein